MLSKKYIFMRHGHPVRADVKVLLYDDLHYHWCISSRHYLSTVRKNNFWKSGEQKWRKKPPRKPFRWTRNSKMQVYSSLYVILFTECESWSLLRNSGRWVRIGNNRYIPARLYSNIFLPNIQMHYRLECSRIGLLQPNSLMSKLLKSGFEICIFVEVDNLSRIVYLFVEVDNLSRIIY